MLSDLEKKQLKYIVQSPQWEAVERFAEEMIKRIQTGSTIKDTEWETLKATIEKEAFIQAIKMFINEIKKNVQG